MHLEVFKEQSSLLNLGAWISLAHFCTNLNKLEVQM
jgi:hypothetical protein